MSQASTLMPWAAVACMLLVPAAGQTPPAAPADLHLLLGTRGAVLLKRPGWTTTVAAGAGALLRRGDLVSVPLGGLATVACADLSVREMPATGRLSGVPCAAGERQALLFEGSLIAATRGDESEDLPTVVAPRRTRLLSPRPLLRWSVPADAGAVSVMVKGPGVNWSARPAAGSTSLAYPADAPALQPDTPYRVTVVAAGRSSDESGDPGVAFTLLPAAPAAEARAGVERIAALKLEADATRLLTAHYLANHGLQAEAIEQLEAMAPAPRPLLTLGMLYQSVGLARLAEARYLQAVKAAAVANDIEAQAQGQLALGAVYQDSMGLKDDAAKAFGEAAALFGKLGDSAAVAAARDKASHAKAP